MYYTFQDLNIPDLVCLVDLTRPQDEAAALHPPGPDSGLGLREAAALLGLGAPPRAVLGHADPGQEGGAGG